MNKDYVINYETFGRDAMGWAILKLKELNSLLNLLNLNYIVDLPKQNDLMIGIEYIALIEIVYLLELLIPAVDLIEAEEDRKLVLSFDLERLRLLRDDCKSFIDSNDEDLEEQRIVA